MIQKLKNISNWISEKFKNSGYKTKRVIAICILALIIALIVVISLLPLMKGGKETTIFYKVELVSEDRQPEIQEFSSSFEPPVLNRIGYDFEGWFMDENYSTNFNIGSIQSKDITIYAKWAPKTFVITFETNGGSEIADISQAYNSQLTIPIPTREAYTFDGWYMEEDLHTLFTLSTMPDNGAELYAKWLYTPFENTLNITANNIVYGNPLNIIVNSNISGGAVSYQYKVQGADDSTYSAALPVNVGLYTVKATSQATSSYKSAIAIADFAIQKATYDMSGAGWNYTVAFGYDGTNKKVEVVGLPNGVTVISYTNNQKTNAGSYTARAMLSYDAVNYNEPVIADLQWWVIEKAENSLSITANNIVYGNPLNIIVNSNISGGAVSYQYKVHGADDSTYSTAVPTQVGNYTVKAITQATTNYESAFDTDDFAINKATYDMSNVSFEDTSIEYDGLNKTIVISGVLPSGVNVTYLNNTGNIEPDEYTITAVFEGDSVNYNSIPDMTADLTIFTLLLIEKSEMDMMAAPLEYDINPMGKNIELWVVSKGSSTSSNILIPDTYYGEAVSVIADYGFENYPMTSIIIGNNIIWIGEDAFKGCNNLQSIYIPQNVDFDGNVFVDCAALEEITVDDNNTNFLSTDGVLFDHDNSIIAYPIGRRDSSYTLPLGTLYVESYSFYNAKNLTELVIAEGLVSIYYSAFKNCTSLENITLPASLLYVYNNVFAGCSSLKTVNVLRPSSLGITNSFDVMFNNYHEDLVIYVVDYASEQAYNANINWKPIGAAYTIIAIKYAVTFDKQDGTGGDDSIEVSIGQEMPFVTTPIKEGYIFSGYYSEAEGEGTQYYNEDMGVAAWDIAEATTLYALWLPGTQGLLFTLINGDTEYSVSRGTATDKNIVIPEVHKGKPVTAMPNDSFKDYSTMLSIIIPASITTVGTNALTGCISLTTLTAPFKAQFNASNNSYLRYYFGGTSWNTGDVPESITTVHIGKGTTGIAADAFRNLSNLTTITIPNTITDFGNSVFLGCTGLINVDFEADSRLKTIGYSVFYQSGITSITLPSSVETLVGSTFTYSELQEIFFEEGSNLKTIGSNTFSGCKLTSITIPRSVTTIADLAFHYCADLVSVVFEENSNLISIGSSAFYNSSMFTSIIIPSSVTTIMQQAFWNCYSLEAVTFGENSQLETIGKEAFRGCGNLESIIIPSNVSEMGNNVFQGCAALTTVRMLSETPPTAGTTIFNGCTALTAIYVPMGSVNAYKTAANWSVYEPIIIGSTLINFDTDGGEELQPMYVQSATDLPTPTKSGGEFLGWYTGVEFETPYDFSTITTSTYTVYAKWFVITQGLRYELINGGTEYAVSKGTATDVHIVIPSVYNGLPVTTLPSWAFDGYSTMISIEIPASITTVENFTFFDCISMVKFTAPFMETYDTPNTGLHYYFGNIPASLKTVIMADNGITSIAPSLFSGASGVTTIKLLDSITSIGAWAFQGCSSLTNITLPESMTTIEERTFGGCSSLTTITLPNSITSIGKSAFSYCSSLSGITIPESVTTVSDDAFLQCTSLTEFNLPLTVTSIGEDIFAYCTSLETFTGPFKGVYEEGTNSYLRFFFGDHSGVPDSLKTVNVADNGITSLAQEAFRSARYLTKITLPDSITSIGDSAFKGCSSLKEFIIPSGITEIGESVFHGCTALTELTLPEGVTTIGYYAFYECGIQEFTLPQGLTTIGYMGFRGSYLTELSIPASVTDIGGYCFAYCPNLTKLIMEGSTPPTAESDLLTGSFEIELIYVPIASVSAYKTSSSWVRYISLIDSSTVMTFESNGGSTISEMVVTSKTQLPIATKEGMLLYGWYMESDFINLYNFWTITTETAKVYAKWAIATEGLSYTLLSGNQKYSVSRGTATDTHVVIPEMYYGKPITTMPADAFRDYSNLESITMPKTMTTVGKNVLTGCTLIHTLSTPYNIFLTYYFGGIEWQESAKVPASLKTVHITEGERTTIADNAFKGCINLTTVTISSGYTTIGNSAFQGCSSLENITIPDTAGMFIGNSAFQDCIGLESISIPGGALVGQNLFTGCTSLVTLSAPLRESYSIYNNSYLRFYFGGTAWNAGGAVPPSLKTFIISNQITTLGYNAFGNCSNLTTVILPDTLTTIMTAAFEASGLTNVTIPESVTEIRAGAFRNISALTTVTMLGVPPTTTEANIFTDCVNLTNIFVPIGSLSVYQTAANWTPYAAKMTGYTVMSFDTDGGEQIEEMLVSAATMLPTPTKAGYTFDGWYSDIERALPYDFATITTSTYTVYAKWQEE